MNSSVCVRMVLVSLLAVACLVMAGVPLPASGQVAPRDDAIDRDPRRFRDPIITRRDCPLTTGPSPISVGAVPTGAFSVALTVKGPAGTYVVTGDYRESFSLKPAGQIQIGTPAAKTRMGRPQGVGRYVPPPPMFETTRTYSAPLPETGYRYVVIAALDDGRSACATASATTARAPGLVPPVGQFFDPKHIDVMAQVPAGARSARLLRDNGTTSAQLVSGRPIATASIDPGPPEFPHDSPLSYGVTLEVTWAERPDGSGRTASARARAVVQSSVSRDVASALARFGLQERTRRVGGDYATVGAADVQVCRAMCKGDPRCTGFSFVKPPFAGNAANCMLKDGPSVAQDSDCCVLGARGVTADVSIVTVNSSGTFDFQQNTDYRGKALRMAREIAVSASPTMTGPAPDIISLTEHYAWTICRPPPVHTVGDYDALDAVIDELWKVTGVVYRIAHMVGQESRFMQTRCLTYVGNALLYNPARLRNVTPADAAGRTLRPHDYSAPGMSLRRSTPICNPGPHKRAISGLLDGPMQSEKCAPLTPTAPAWTLLIDGFDATAATLARLAFVHDSRDSFDVVTIHPSNSVFWRSKTEPVPEDDPSVVAVRRAYSDFVSDLSRPPFRTVAASLPTLIVGDMNSGAVVGWFPGVGEAYFDRIDVMAVMMSVPQGSAAPRALLNVGRTATLPPGVTLSPPSGGDGPQRIYPPGRSFSDHVGLRVDFVDASEP